MKIAMNAVLVNEKLEPILADNNLYTLGVHCIGILLGLGLENADPDEKGKRFDLFMKIRNQDEVELSTTEIALLQRLVGQHSTPLVLGQARELLEGRENPLVIDRKAAE